MSSQCLPAVRSVHLLLWWTLISRQSLYMPGSSSFLTLVCSLHNHDLTFSAQSCVWGCTAHCPLHLNLAQHVFFLLSLSKVLLHRLALAQRPESPAKTRCTVVLILTLSFLLLQKRLLSFVSKQFFILLLFCKQQPQYMEQLLAILSWILAWIYRVPQGLF